MAVPMVGIYLPLYDYLLEQLRQQQVGATAPLLAGTLARTASVLCTAPLELVRTRLQAARQLPAYSLAALDREMQLLPEWFLERHLQLALEIGRAHV